jgi:regulator of protease activity HflC (stomatin/prohibitin superfamily)
VQAPERSPEGGSKMQFIAVGFVIIFILANAIRVLREYERGVIFRLGRLLSSKGPGLIILIPIVDRMVKVSLRMLVMDVPPQDVITKDNVSVKVNAVVYFRVMEPNKAVTEVEDYMYATSQLAQTTLRSVLGEAELDDLLSNREKINTELQQILDKHTDPWGIKVSTVEVKHVDLPVEMQRAMARQAEAERERRAKVIKALGELQASEKLSEAAKVIGEFPVAIQLRYLQTLTDVAAENNSTTLFPIPIDLFKMFMEKSKS